jgi:ADP-heptose:LPS heptosyltransferase
VRALGEEHPAEFFRIIVEALADSFKPALAEAYETLMEPWIPRTQRPSATPVIPARVETVYVLSRVTLGSDIKITSPILSAMKTRFPAARIVFVAGRKSAELFAADPRIHHLEVEYPRVGPVSLRIEFAHQLRRMLEGENRIVVDPDTRLTQLGLIPVCEPEHYFHFPSRTAGGDSSANLSDLTKSWLHQTFGVSGEAYVAPTPVEVVCSRPYASVSLGVGGNNSKRISDAFEADLIRDLAERYRTVWIDRGAGGEEAQRVSQAAANSGALDRVRFWEGSFAGFVSVIAQSAFYAGYDSAGQHAAAAAGIPLRSIFVGAISPRFQSRWSPK